MIEPGATLGAYRIERLLGHGGMGAVFLAYDTSLRRQIAIKIVADSADAVAAHAHLLREARNAAALNHPNICTIHEVGRSGDTAFIAMEYVDGEPLSERISRGPLPPAAVIRLGSQAADALAYAHQHDVVHRDLKAANVILSAADRPTLVDFGLARRSMARIVDATTTVLVVETGRVAGTPYSMAPEQTRGEEVDHRADIWALGVLLYEMATAARPFHGRSGADLFSAILRDPPAPMPASVPDGLRRVIERCLQKDPADRFQDAGDVLDALGVLEENADATSAPPPTITRRSITRTAAAIIAALIVVAVALAAVALRARLTDVATAPVRIAVLPIRNLTGDTGQEYFVDGLTEEMITQLGRMHPQGLGVIARTSSMRYKTSDKPIAEIGAELGVDYVLEGSARREGERVRISATLIRVNDQTQRWSDSFDRELSGILALQSDVARGVASSLALTLLPAQSAALANAKRVNPEVYDAILKGRSHALRLTRADLDTAEQYFQLALSKDPNAAEGYVGIASVWTGRQQMQFAVPAVAAPRLKAALAKALQLDENLAAVHYQLALQRAWTDWDWPAAEAAFRRAIELDGSFPESHAFYGHYLYMMQRRPEARGEMQRALQLDPLSDHIQSLHATTLGFEHRFAEQAAELRDALKTNPGSPLALANLSEALHSLRRYDEALEAERARWAARGNGAIPAALSAGRAEGGYRAAMRRAADAQAEAGFTGAIAIAKLYTRAGATEQALEWLDRAVERHDPNAPYLGVADVWEPLRGLARFKQLLRRLNLPS
jgi:TolB-like protein/predicted Ser/Thr protein kinase